MYFTLIITILFAALSGLGAVYCWELHTYYHMAICIVATVALLLFAQVVFTAMLHRRIMGYGR